MRNGSTEAPLLVLSVYWMPDATGGTPAARVAADRETSDA